MIFSLIYLNIYAVNFPFLVYFLPLLSGATVPYRQLILFFSMKEIEGWALAQQPMQSKRWGKPQPTSVQTVNIIKS